MQSAYAQLWRFDQQVTQVIEHTEMQLVGGAGDLWNFRVIAPGAGIDQGVTSRVPRVFDGDEKTTGYLQQVGMLRISPVEQLDISVIQAQGAEGDGQRFANTPVGQQPGVVAFPSWQIRDTRKGELQLVIDTLWAAYVELPAIRKISMSYDLVLRRVLVILGSQQESCYRAKTGEKEREYARE